VRLRATHPDPRAELDTALTLLVGAACRAHRHSHSIVAGGFDEMS